MEEQGNNNNRQRNILDAGIEILKLIQGDIY